MATLEKAFGYQGDNMNLPVRDLAAALPFYETVLGFQVLSRSDTPHKSAVLGRDAIQIRLAENGGDPSQDGSAFHVNGVESLFAEFKANGLQREARFDTERRGDITWKVFYVVGLTGSVIGSASDKVEHRRTLCGARLQQHRRMDSGRNMFAASRGPWPDDGWTALLGSGEHLFAA